VEVGVRPGDHDVAHETAAPGGERGTRGDGRVDVAHGPAQGHEGLPAESVRESQLHGRDRGRLAGDVRRQDERRHGRGLDRPERVEGRVGESPPERLEDRDLDLGDPGFVAEVGARDLGAPRERRADLLPPRPPP
jgi:hypothetical protein